MGDLDLGGKREGREGMEGKEERGEGNRIQPKGVTDL